MTQKKMSPEEALRSVYGVQDKSNNSAIKRMSPEEALSAVYGVTAHDNRKMDEDETFTPAYDNAVNNGKPRSTGPLQELPQPRNRVERIKGGDASSRAATNKSNYDPSLPEWSWMSGLGKAFMGGVSDTLGQMASVVNINTNEINASAAKDKTSADVVKNPYLTQVEKAALLRKKSNNDPKLLNELENQRRWAKEKILSGQEKADPGQYNMPSSAMGMFTHDVVRAMPYTLLSMAENIPIALATGGTGALLSSLASASMEAQTEQAGVYDEAIKRGLSHDEAYAMSQKTLAGNMLLLPVSNYLQTVAATGVTRAVQKAINGNGSRILAKSMQNPGIKKLLTSDGGRQFGSTVLDAFSEGMEEVAQGYISEKTLGNPIDKSALAYEGAVGGLMGALFGLTGSTADRIKNAPVRVNVKGKAVNQQSDPFFDGIVNDVESAVPTPEPESEGDFSQTEIQMGVRDLFQRLRGIPEAQRTPEQQSQYDTLSAILQEYTAGRNDIAGSMARDSDIDIDVPVQEAGAPVVGYAPGGTALAVPVDMENAGRLSQPDPELMSGVLRRFAGDYRALKSKESLSDAETDRLFAMDKAVAYINSGQTDAAAQMLGYLYRDDLSELASKKTESPTMESPAYINKDLAVPTEQPGPQDSPMAALADVKKRFIRDYKKYGDIDLNSLNKSNERAKAYYVQRAADAYQKGDFQRAVNILSHLYSSDVARGDKKREKSAQQPMQGRQFVNSELAVPFTNVVPPNGAGIQNSGTGGKGGTRYISVPLGGKNGGPASSVAAPQQGMSPAANIIPTTNERLGYIYDAQAAKDEESAGEPVRYVDVTSSVRPHAEIVSEIKKMSKKQVREKYGDKAAKAKSAEAAAKVVEKEEKKKAEAAGAAVNTEAVQAETNAPVENTNATETLAAVSEPASEPTNEPANNAAVKDNIFLGKNGVKGESDKKHLVATKKQREAALKKIYSDKRIKPAFRQYYVDEEGRQCFTDTRVAFRLKTAVSGIKQESKEGPAVPRMTGTYADGRPLPFDVATQNNHKVITLNRDDIVNAIALGKRYPEADTGNESNGIYFTKIGNEYVSSELLGHVLSVLGSDSVEVKLHPQDWRPVYFNSKNGDALLASMTSSSLNANEKRVANKYFDKHPFGVEKKAPAQESEKVLSVDEPYPIGYEFEDVVSANYGESDSPYDRSLVRKRKVIEIKSDGNYCVQDEGHGGADILSRDKLKEAIERAPDNIAQLAESRKLAAKKEENDKAAAAAKREDERLGGFTDNMSNMERGRALAVLNKKLRYDHNRIMSRRSYIEECAAKAGARAEVQKDGTRALYMEPDSGTYYQMTKIEHDYFNFLKSKKDTDGSKVAPPKKSGAQSSNQGKNTSKITADTNAKYSNPDEKPEADAAIEETKLKATVTTEAKPEIEKTKVKPEAKAEIAKPEAKKPKTASNSERNPVLQKPAPDLNKKEKDASEKEVVPQKDEVKTEEHYQLGKKKLKKIQEQVADVRARYENTPHWMKSPNGETTRLTEDQWVAVRTPAFKDWFGDWEKDSAHSSQVVDEDTGEPQVVYHFTYDKFNVFQKGKLGLYTVDNANDFDIAATSMIGFWFNEKSIGDDGVTMPVFLNIRNPHYAGNLWGELVGELSEYRTEKQFDNNSPSAIRNAGRAYRKDLQWNGKDGLILHDDEYGGTSFVVFESNQVKSATGNNGGYNSKDKNIHHQIGTAALSDLPPVDVEEIRARVTGAKVSDIGNGRASVAFPNGRTWLVDMRANEIKPDAEIVKRDYGRDVARDDVVRGRTRVIGAKTFIDMVAGMSDPKTFSHEVFEAAWDSFTNKEKGVVLNTYKSRENAAERYADFLENRLGKTTKATQRIFQRVKDFFANIRASLFGKNSEDVFRSVAEGRLWKREAGVSADSEHYRLSRSTKTTKSDAGNSPAGPSLKKPAAGVKEEVKADTSVVVEDRPEWMEELGIDGDLERVVRPSRQNESLKDKLVHVKNNFYRQWFDKLDPLKKHFGKDVYFAAENAIYGASSRAERRFEKGDPEIGVKGLLEIMKDIPADKADGFAVYAVYKHLNDVAGNSEALIKTAEALKERAKAKRKELAEDLKLPSPDAEALKEWKKRVTALRAEHDLYLNQANSLLEAVKYTKGRAAAYADAVKKIDAKYPKWEKAQQELVKYNQALLDLLTDSGIISEDMNARLKELYPNYVPLQRDFGLDPDSVNGFVGGMGLVNISSPIKRLKGSARDVIDPLEQIVRNTYQFEAVAARQETGKLILEEYDNGNFRDLLEEVKNTHHNPDEMVVYIWDKGTKRLFKTEKDIYEALVPRKPSSWEDNPIVAASKFVTGLLRKGTTHGLSFALRNPVRDTFNYAIVGENFRPFVDTVRGLMMSFDKSAGSVYDDFMKSGGSQGMTVLTRDQQAQHIKQLRHEKDAVLMSWSSLKNPPKFIYDLIGQVSEYGELASRLGQFERAKAKGFSSEKAANITRDNMNFMRSGTIGELVNQHVGFFNASLQGVDKMRRAFYSDGKINKKAIMRSLLYITAPSILQLLYNYDDDDRRKRYMNLPAWRKNTFWNFVIGKDGPILSIPKPFEIGMIFGSLPERFMEYSYTKNKRVFDGVGTSMLSSLTPEFYPNALLLMAELGSNHSFFYQRPILSKRDERFEPPLQYGPYTAEWAKAIGKALNISPKVLEYSAFSLGGGLAKEVSNVSDSLVRKYLTHETRPERPWYETMPGVRGFFTRDGDAIETTFQDELTILQKKRATAQEVYKTGGLSALNKAQKNILRADEDIKKLSGINTRKGGIFEAYSAIRQITVDPKLSAIEKRVRIGRIEEWINRTSERGLAYIDKLNGALDKK